MRSRAHALTEIAPAIARLYQDMAEIVPPESIDPSLASDKITKSYQHGVALLYGAGLATWQSMRDKLVDIDLTQYYTPEQIELMERYTFNRTPERVTSAFIQSAMTAPSIFMAWWGDAFGLCDREVPGRLWCQELASDQTLENLVSPWFVTMLRQGSVTNSGFYRNSTGFELDFKSHMTRSARKPMLAFESESSSKIITIDEYGIPVLSKEFIYFLRNRLRKYNQSVLDGSTSETSPIEGTSAGCPMAHGPNNRNEVFQLAPKYLSEVILMLT